MSNPQQFLQLLRLVVMAAAAAATAGVATKADPSTVLPSCQSRCGSVSIPYPFGIGPGCHREGFDVRCNTTFLPPKPFIGDTDAELIDVSLLTGEARAYKHIDWVCYNMTGIVNYKFVPINLTTRPAYQFSRTRNKFTGVGCSAVAFVGGDNGNDYVSGCVTVCSSLASSTNGTCAGVGCCQTSIPMGLRSAGTELFITYRYRYARRVWSYNPCSYAFIVEEDRYNFSSDDLIAGHLESKNKLGMPVVLDWAIGNQTCKEARSNSTPASSYACVDDHSECVDSSNGPGAGYLCNCSSGYQGNPYLVNGCKDIDECSIPLEYPCYGVCTNTAGSYNCSCPRGKDGDPHTKNGCISTGSSFPLVLKVLTATMGSVFFLTVLSFGTYLGLQKRKLMCLKQKFFQQNGGLILQQQLNSSRAATFKLFTQEELERATNKFDSKLIIGRGGHGTVYKGTLEDQRVVAVKKSKMVDEGQTKEFAREMLILSQINHKNVIKILGCCLEVEIPMLVYEFIPNGTLFEYLHESIHRITIPLEDRLRIAEESASALAYLHSAASPPIIHGDVKSSNILLDQQYSAKVSDFGASKMVPKDGAQLATVVQGTCGYLDPEYLVTCQLTEKSDVYSFGVVILELLTRMKAFEFDVAGQERGLASIFLTAMKEDKLSDVLDDQIGEDVDMVLAAAVAELAVRCLNFAGDERPTMKEVADGLERLRKSGKHDVVPQSNQHADVYYSMAISESIFAHDASETNTSETLHLLNMELRR